MRKGWIIAFIILCAILFSIGVAFGVYSYQRGKTQDSNMLDNSQLASKKVENLKNNSTENKVIETSASDIKLSPNCTIVEKEYYKGCDHLIKQIKQIPEELINYKEDEIKQIYIGWTIESFANNQVIVYKEQEGFCPKHYVIKEHNGYLAIYTLDENGIQTWKKDTDISTMYLPEEDLTKVRDGISAIGDDQLHNVLEDFE